MKHLNTSIIICCYNSFSRLAATLRHISLQRVTHEFTWEVILVDNNSSDNSSDIAKLIWKELGAPVELRIIFEPLSGLSNARKAGVLNSSGEVIVFCDDDNWLASSYIQTAYKILEECPSVGVVGGRSYPVADAELPNWFTTVQGNYAVGVQALDTGIISNRKYVWGAGMAFRRDDYLDLLKAGFVNLGTDRSGSSFDSGGDSEICRWFLLAGFVL